MEQLVLQRARTGRDDDAATRKQRRHEVRERLAGAGARFDDQLRTLRERGRDVFGHRDLLRSGRITRQCAGERAVGPRTSASDAGHGQEKTARNRNKAVAPGARGFSSTQRTWVYSCVGDAMRVFFRRTGRLRRCRHRERHAAVG